MRLQPTASLSALLLACPRPFEVEMEYSPTTREPARYGSAFHQVLAACLRSKAGLSKARYAAEVERAAKKYGVDGQELAGHVRSSEKVLRHWLEREKLQVTAVETAFACKPLDDGSASWLYRKISPHDEEHRYEAGPDEIPGTIDLIAQSAAGSRQNRSVIIDHKTGNDDGFARPSKLPQLRTLGLRFRDGVEVGIFHADRRGLPIVYSEPYEPDEASAHARALHAALGRIGQGWLRPGPHCQRCPAREGCPAHDADLLSESTAALVRSANALADEPVDPSRALAPPENGSTVEMRAAALYDLLKKFRALDKASSEEIRRLVREGRLIETREGALVLQTQSFETLSKKSVVDALGKIAGERELKRLRAKGAIRTSTRELLVAEPEKSR